MRREKIDMERELEAIMNKMVELKSESKQFWYMHNIS
jgi:hypothetical protein